MVIYKSACAPVPIPDVDLYTFLFTKNKHNSVRSWDTPQIIDGQSGKTLSFNEIRTLSGKIGAGWINKAGLQKDDVVAVFAPNHYDHSVLFFSLLAARCVITPGNPGYTEAEFHHQIHTAGAKALVTVPELLPVLTRVCDKVGIARERIFVFGESTPEARSFYTLGEGEQPVTRVEGVQANDVAFLCFSSGTTGLAKGVMLTHRNFVAQMLQVTAFDEAASRPNDVVLGFLPFYHIFGLTSLVFGTFHRATPLIVMPKFNLEAFCRLVEKYKVTNTSIVPPVAVQLGKNAAVEKYDLSSLRLIGCGAAPLSREHIEAIRRRIPAIIRNGYGMTETAAGCVYQKVEGSAAGSIGHLVPNMELKLVDENGVELGNDQEGEVLLRGPAIMKGYLNNPEANEKTFTADGWMRTGDVGKLDSASGEFFIVDRIKELVKYKGFQVAPAELEALLLSHDMVADCCVIGVYDHSQATELPRAYVVLQPGVQPTPANNKALLDFVASNVINYKKLRGGIRFVDAIPKSPSGKILRRTVREWAKKEEAETRVSARL